MERQRRCQFDKNEYVGLAEENITSSDILFDLEKNSFHYAILKDLKDDYQNLLFAVGAYAKNQPVSFSSTDVFRGMTILLEKEGGKYFLKDEKEEINGLINETVTWGRYQQIIKEAYITECELTEANGQLTRRYKGYSKIAMENNPPIIDYSFEFEDIEENSDGSASTTTRYVTVNLRKIGGSVETAGDQYTAAIDISGRIEGKLQEDIEILHIAEGTLEGSVAIRYPVWDVSFLMKNPLDIRDIGSFVVSSNRILVNQELKNKYGVSLP